MRTSGVAQPTPASALRGTTRRIGGLLAAVALGTAACSSSSSAKSQTPPTLAPSATITSTPTPHPSVPAGCHSGVANSVQGTVAILTDGPKCPGSVNAYWTSQLGAKWTAPVFIPYRDGQIPNNACGKTSGDPQDFADNAFYCPADDTIAYSQDLLNSLFKEGGPYAAVVVLEHELGHRANRIAGVVGVISRSEENQADCDAGVTTAFARSAGRLPLTDVFAAADQFFKLGDTRHFGNELATSANAHGTPSQRAIAFGRGYLQHLPACRAIGQSPDGTVG